MPVAVQQAQQRPSGFDQNLDRIAKGLQIATSLFNIPVGIMDRNRQIAKEDADEEARKFDKALKIGELANKGFSYQDGQVLKTPEQLKREAEDRQRLIDKETAGIALTKAQTKKANRESVSVGKGKPLTAEASIKIGSFNAAKNLLGNFEKSLKSTEDFNKLGKINPLRYVSDTDTSNRIKTFESQRDQMAQLIGTALEGGKLTDEDFENKYKPMFPKIDDPPTVKSNKMANIKKLVYENKNAMVSALQSGGFDASNFAMEGDIPENPLSGGEGLTPPISRAGEKTKIDPSLVEVMKKRGLLGSKK